jgi:Putative prokaryotic signal transducing protein
MPADEEDFQELFRGNAMELSVVRGVLEGAGIPFVVHGLSEGGFGPLFTDDAQLLVRAADLERARALLAADPDEPELPAAKADDGSPRCTRHDRESIGPCARCGTFLCEACGDECPTCAESRAAQTRPRNSNTTRIVALLVLAFFCGVPGLIAALIRLLAH